MTEDRQSTVQSPQSAGTMQENNLKKRKKLLFLLQEKYFLLAVFSFSL
jgi:hypothetical protein